ncbi:YjcB protein [Klebsiella pneumoniae]|nr:YjcB protein [Klebsiella pneumoniae]
MASITTSVVLLRWPLVSAVLMFLASSLNIQLRKSDYAGLAVICSCLGLAAACWFRHRFARYHPARYCQNLGQYQRCDD